MIPCHFTEIINHLFLRPGYDIVLRFILPVQPFLDKIHRVLLYLRIYLAGGIILWDLTTIRQ
jgi:hypothetical protein